MLSSEGSGKTVSGKPDFTVSVPHWCSVDEQDHASARIKRKRMC